MESSNRHAKPQWLFKSRPLLAVAVWVMGAGSVFGVVPSIMFLGETLAAPLFVGFALTFAGIVVRGIPAAASRKKACAPGEVGSA